MKQEMSIEHKLEIMRKALEMGGKFNISFHRLPSKGKAKEIIEHFATQLNVNFKNYQNEWFSLENSIIDITAFYKLSVEEEKEKLLAQLAALEDGGQSNEATN